MFFSPTMYNTQYNIQFNSFIVHCTLQKKCNHLLHELDMFEKARNNIKITFYTIFLSINGEIDKKLKAILH